MNIQSEFDYLVKIALLGDTTVGKTNLVSRFTDNIFISNNPPTLGYDFKSKTILLKNSKKKAKLQIWDTAGQERYMSLCKTVFQRVDGVILVYDITEIKSFDNILNWIKIVKEFNDKMPILLIGNKTDLEDNRLISYEEGKKLADENNLKFFETSALNGNNVDEAFILFGNIIVDYLKKKSSMISDSFSIDKNTSTVRKSKKCC